MGGTPTRRAFLKWTALGAGVILLPIGVGSGYLWAQASRGNVGRVVFASPLRIPPLASVSAGADGRRVIDLSVQEGRIQLRPGGVARTWGVNQAYLGPTIRIRRGETIAPRVRNLLPEPTSLHWHGMELPAASDGGPHERIAPGDIWEPVWRIDQHAATLWYHPHLHGTTKEHVYRGVAGLLLVDDDNDPGLPDEYGVDDIPVVVQDKKFTGDGALDLSGISFGGIDVVGMLGDEILVNGTWGPLLSIRRELTRLRVLNASNGRVYRFVFDDRRGFHVVGTDAGLLSHPIAAEEIQLSPGERAELVVRMRPGERIRLCSEPPDLTGSLIHEHFAGGDDRFEILQLDAAPELESSEPLPTALPSAPPVAVPAPGRELREFALGEFTINDRTIDMHRTDLVVETGSTEEWRVRNTTDTPHNFHIHNARFDILAIDGQAPAITGPKDTVYVRPGTRVDLRVHFGQHADPHTPYMYHCHVLAHEDAGMMGQFVIVDPGTAPPGTTDRGMHSTGGS
ncbi:multicopper oxidase domain-containing protein [Agromyces sp. H66]|uniref:multicopper oxidase family protein n=1 Tax=Agromyces sp. H66 TaxID=2529859 RepID=UPI0010AAA882|nr:multicopper oxidase domain-containing protein [Agromyces sp. H66]